jgi:hypothetical protein
MKKIIFLPLAALALCAGACLIAWVAAPITTGVVLLANGVILTCKTLGLPGWLAVLVFLALLPTAVFLAVRAFSPKFRKWATVAFITLAVAYAFGMAAWKHKDDFGQIVHSAFDPIEKWEAAQHDKHLVELTNENESNEKALQIQSQQLQMEKAARLHDREAFIRQLLDRVDSKQTELATAETNLPDSPLQIVSQAHHSLADVKTTLTSILTNNSFADLADLQAEVQAAASNADLAADKIQAASAAQAQAKLTVPDTAATKSALETKEQQDAAELKRLDDQRLQSKLAAEKNVANENEHQQAEADGLVAFSPLTNTSPVERQTQNHIGLRGRMRHWLGQDSVVTVTMQNATGYTLYITFSSPKWQHIWPEGGRAFVAQPGETVNIGLRGFPGEQIFYKAWAAQNPNLQWNACDCGENGQPSPIAICGDDDPPLLRLVEQPQQLSFDGRGF